VRNLQNRVAFQGERGAFSEIAAIKFFGSSIQPILCKTFKEVFQRINNKEAEYGILPIENSQTGGINEVHDLLLHQELFAVGEVKLKVEHCLITKEEIKESKENNIAAIASSWAAELYGLKILNLNIQDNKFNYTRFLILSPEINLDPKNNKTSIIFAVVSKPGALYRCLKEFAVRDINLNRLESRPSKREPWEYIFYTDFEKGLHKKETQEALKSLEKCTTFIKIIGSYYSE